MLLGLILAPFVASLIAAVLPATARRHEAWLAGGVALFGLLATIQLYLDAGDEGVVRYRVAWLPQAGLDFVLRMDGLAWVFALLVQGIGLLVVLYARYYMSPQDPVPRFFSFLLAFMGSMLGVVLSGNLIQMLVFWELTSLTSFLLIGYWHHRIDARRGARMAFTVTAAGGLCLLAGLLIIGQIVGSYDLDAVLAAGDTIRAHDLYLPALILIALGALTKSAQFPFHFWLPHAMAAPTPVSAYLHSATMVKAGVFLLARLWPVLSGTPEWGWIIGGAGVITLLLGSFVAIFQSDLKGLLAYSTISHLGLITLLLGIGTPLGLVAAIFHIINHATFKASLFMAAGIIDHETGTRDMRVLRGLRHALPITATLAIVACAAMAGVPLLNGFLSKEMFFDATLVVGGQEHWWMSVAAVAMGVFSVTYALRFISIFFGALATDLPKVPHEPPHWMRLPVEVLVVLCLVVGIVPGLSVAPLLDAAVTSVLGVPPSYSLAVWHGFNIPLFMSLAAVLGGILLYVVLQRYFDLRHRDGTPAPLRLDAGQIYDTLMLRLSVGATWLIGRLGTRRLQPQLLLMVVLLLALPALLVRPMPALDSISLGALDPYFAAIWLIGAACAVAAAWQAKYHRLAALILVGGTGIVTSMTFLWLSAPDLALTQLMVETVTTILILLGLRWLPPRIEPRELSLSIPRGVWVRRSRDLAIAVAGGLAMAVVSLLVLSSAPPADGIGDFFVLRALPEGGGSNVVNVLLVDFRGFDTLGEITVLAIVALTVYALLRRFRPAPESIAIPAQRAVAVDPAAGQGPLEQVEHGYLRIPAIYVRFLMPFVIVVAAFYFMRGHNLPGGGFVAGLIFAVAFIMQYMMAGAVWVESHLRLHPHEWMAWGLLTAFSTGAGAWLFGYPFLTSHTLHLELPILGEIHLPSAFLFDLGVFAVVVGATMLILAALAHQSVRSHRSSAGDGKAPPQETAELQ